MKNNLSNRRKLVNTSMAGKGGTVHELNRKNTEKIDRLYKLISDELSKSDHVVSIEGRSTIEVKQTSAGFIGIIYCNDGSYGETACVRTYDLAVVEAIWRSRAWHDEPILTDDKRIGNGKNQKSESAPAATSQTNGQKKMRYLDQTGQRKMCFSRLNLKNSYEVKDKTRKQAADKIKILGKLTHEEEKKARQKEYLQHVWGNKPRKQKDRAANE